jgi:HK97 family phage prohead protease
LLGADPVLSSVFLKGRSRSNGGTGLFLFKMVERRSLISELRIDGSDHKPVITGHAAVFNQRSRDLGGFYEVIAPGAFANTIKSADTRALFNHDQNFVLGRVKSGTLALSEDEKGLFVRISPPDSIWANDLLESIKRGDIDQMSFAFSVSEAGQTWQRSGGEVLRTLLNIDELFDVSPVTNPAYPQTDVSARSFFEGKIRNLASENPEIDPNLAPNPDFLARMEARRQFIDSRTPPPDPRSLAEIIKRARIVKKENQ